MKSFGNWLNEAIHHDMVDAAVKYKIVYGNKTPDGQHNEKIGRRVAASHGINFDQVEAELSRSWKPGGCPTCHGLGLMPDYSQCLPCAGTGLQGMTPQQSSWWVAKHKELEAMSKRNWHYKDIHGIPKMKLAQDIVTAAKRAGVSKPEDAIDWGDDEDSIYTAEYYEGHEQDFYINGLESLLRRIAEAMFKKSGHKPGPWHK